MIPPTDHFVVERFDVEEAGGPQEGTTSLRDFGQRHPSDVGQVLVRTLKRWIGAQSRGLLVDVDEERVDPFVLSVCDTTEIRDCDVLISVPKLKRHGGATVTIALKNMMGAIPRSEMSRFHQTELSQCIADLNTAVKPHLSVVDATYVMARTGPTNGDLVEMDAVLTSFDPVAVDRIAAQRLHDLEEAQGIPSFNPASVKHINDAAALGVGNSDLNAITIIESSVA